MIDASNLANMVEELCNRFGGKLREAPEEEIVCRISFTSPQQAQSVFQDVSEYLAKKLGFEKTGLGTQFRLSKTTNSGFMEAGINVGNAYGYITKALEIRYAKDAFGKPFLELTPITKKGRGCTLYLGINTLGVYCEKNGCYASAEGCLWY